MQWRTCSEILWQTTRKAKLSCRNLPMDDNKPKDRDWDNAVIVTIKSLFWNTLTKTEKGGCLECYNCWKKEGISRNSRNLPKEDNKETNHEVEIPTVTENISRSNNGEGWCCKGGFGSDYQGYHKHNGGGRFSHIGGDGNRRVSYEGNTQSFILRSLKTDESDVKDLRPVYKLTIWGGHRNLKKNQKQKTKSRGRVKILMTMIDHKIRKGQKNME